MTEPLAAAEAAVRAGNPQQALVALTAAVKASPAKPALRVFLAQLLCVTGAWERAHTQLNVVADMDATTGPMREMVGHALRCELLRAAVFEGKRSPMVFGQPDEWLAMLIESMLQSGQGASDLSHQLAARAFEAAPATSGQINGEPFEWIADADSRLGPIFEAMIDGRYCWVPMSRVQKLLIEPPTDLRDLVWIPAQFIWTNGGNSAGFIPARYPGTESSADSALKLARKTEWVDRGEELFAGLGQRIFTTDQTDVPLFEVRTVEFAAPAPAAT